VSHLEKEDMVEAAAAVAKLKEVEYLLRHTQTKATHLGSSRILGWHHGVYETMLGE
jgi:hypothetical protein